MKMTIKDNFPEVRRALDGLRKEIAGPATVRALNGTVAQAKTAMSREIRAEFNLSAGKVNQALRIVKASAFKGGYNITAALESPSQRGRSLNLINFSARQTSKGVSVKIKKSGGRKLIRSAFIANAGRTVFRRVGDKRLPIKALQTIDVAQMFNTKRINARVVKFMESKFPEVFEREVRYYTDKFNRGRV